MAVGEWDQRQLCPNGGCIGVIGPDGTCKVCGHVAPNWGDERNRGLLDPPDGADDDDGDEDDDDEDRDGVAADGDDDDDDDDDDDEDGDDDDDGEDEPEDDGAGSHRAAGPRGDWSGRALCPDGGCVGVIGADGRCKVCGRWANEAAGELSVSAVEAPAKAADAPEAAPAAEVAEPAATGDDKGVS
jgi:hypothetical protein